MRNLSRDHVPVTGSGSDRSTSCSAPIAIRDMQTIRADLAANPYQQIISNQYGG